MKNLIILTSLIFSINLCYSQESQLQNDNESKTIITRFPEFPSGDVGLFKYLGKKAKIPKELKKSGITGQVKVKFIIGEEGEILKDSIRIQSGVHPLIDKEAIRIVKEMPNWIPGLNQKGEKIECWYILPINF
jgi:TonB family protein